MNNSHKFTLLSIYQPSIQRLLSMALSCGWWPRVERYINIFKCVLGCRYFQQILCKQHTRRIIGDEFESSMELCVPTIEHALFSLWDCVRAPEGGWIMLSIILAFKLKDKRIGLINSRDYVSYVFLL